MRDYHSEDESDDSVCNYGGAIAEEQMKNIFEMQLGRINAFKSQDVENGNFDVTFDLSGKLLYADKYIFKSVSSPMEAMISERWSTKDDIIKIETYTYEEFFQFILFLYSGICDITQDNIFQLIDLAEFFDVSVMKNYCDKYFCEMIPKISVKTVEEMMEMAQKYSLSKSIAALRRYIRQNMKKIIQSDGFPKYQRPFLDVLFSSEKACDDEEQLFLSVVKWIENQVSTKEPTLEGTELLDAVKTEFDGIKSMFDYSNMSTYFIIEFVVSKDYLYSTSDLYKILGNCVKDIGDEKYFQTIFQIAEKQALKEQNTSIDEKFNLQNVIKRELSEILPTIDFKYMELEFVKEFVVDKAQFLFSSKKLYQIIAERYRSYNEETTNFEMLYQLAINNVEKKQSSEEIIDLPTAIKKELAGCLSKIKFHKMGTQYLVDFAVKTGFISREQAIKYSYINVEINSSGKLLSGEFEDILKIHCRRSGVRRIPSGWTTIATPRSENELQFPGLTFDVPDSPSPVQSMCDIEWYLLLEKDGILTAKHRSIIKSGDYLIAELRANEDFVFDEQETRITVSYNNIFC